MGDIIVEAEGQPVARLADLARELENVGIGGTADLVILRGEERVPVQVGVEDIGESQ